MLRKNFLALKRKFALGLFTSFLTLGIIHSVMAAPAQDPLFLTQPVRPIMMLNMSRDHQLFFKLYDDYSDLTNEDGGEPDGEADTTYVHAYEYYGYFDSRKCYTYDSGQNKNYYVPSRFVNDAGYCNYQGGTGEWSGNFLNWATMTRIDAVRKILYGGLRANSGDTASLTILERAFLPQDAHSFAKYYNGSDVSQLTPFGSSNSVTTGQNSTNSGITICNTTDPSNRNNLSQNDTGAPKMKVARGNYSLWASNERWQCRWSEDNNASNDNDSSLSGINAYSSNPSRTNRRLGGRDFSVRVSVCVNGKIDGETNNENCQAYGDNWKPKGLLQEYGATGQIHFGLLTGSYSKNKSGGVLRKPVGNMANEVNAADGTFVRPAGNAKNSHYGIIQTLDSLRIYGYRFDDGTYHRNSHGNDSNGSDGCLWSRSSFSNGHCMNWGNPQSEIFLESLRYLAGLTSSDTFAADDSGRLSGLNTSDWTRPITNNNYCSPLSVIQFNASTSSYDGDQLDASDIGLANVAASTNAVGDAEGLHGGDYFIGRAGGNTDDDLCTAKRLNGLADALGTCPDAPRLEGSYKIAGLAYHARKNGIPLTGVTKGTGKQTIRTYGVALAPAVPRVNVRVPGSTQTITILPACRNINSTLSTPANCALVDFKIVDQEFGVSVDGSTANTGRLYVNWEDSEQGGDFDQDMWGVINYVVTATQVKVTTQVMAQSTGDPMGFGYVISGTTEDGFHVHSGVNNFTYGTSCTTSGNTRCTCRENDRNSNAFNGTAGACNTDHPAAVARNKTFTVGASSAKLLEQPLYYAAKWGGYKEDTATAADIKAADPETYFYATDPRELEKSLKAAFASVADSVGSASAVATNSTRLSEESFLYQARFNSKNWSGELLAYPFNNATNGFDGTVVSTNSTLRTDTINSSTRKIYTYNGEDRTEFKWDSLTLTQKGLLMDGDGESVGQSRVDWLRGAKVAGLREREKSGENEFLLGDIVNSSPAYLGGTDMRYDRLPGNAGSTYRAYLNNTKRKDALSGSESFARVFVGANDGMLHAFDAATLEEKFAYVPAGVYPKLANITKTTYGTGGDDNPHQYLVDGPVAVGDAYLDGAWKSIVVGTLGAGGKGIFALDVTDPNQPPKVLFELNNIQHLGYVMKQPYIVPLKDGDGIRWAVVFGNGYEAGSSALFWVDLEDGDGDVEVNTIVAPSGVGLSAPALLPNGVGIVEAAYAGDLSGNLWKFDLSSTADANWDATLLFSAKTTGANPVAQAITAAPTLGRNAKLDNRVMVYFGTGQYLYHDDNTSNLPTQSFYAIVDKGEEIAGKNQLHKKVIVAREGGGRDITLNTINWAMVNGWYMDLPTADERVITKSLLLNDKVILTTMIPSAIPCEYGGSSWILEIAAVGDKYIGQSILDDNIYQDFLTLNDTSFALIPEAPPSDGGDGGDDDPEPPQQCDEGEYPGKIFVPGSAGTVTSEDACLSKGSLGRMSWRQLR